MQKAAVKPLRMLTAAQLESIPLIQSQLQQPSIALVANPIMPQANSACYRGLSNRA